MNAQLQEVPAVKAPRAKTEYTEVELSDGRKVQFAGKRKMNKEYLVNDEQMEVVARFDFLNGETRSFTVPTSLLLKFAGHGALQKIGDETAGEEDVDDMLVAVDSIIGNLSQGLWTTRVAGDGFSGASVVIKALVEASGKTVQEIKDYLQGKLDQAKAKGETLTRNSLYASFRSPKSKVGQIIQRLEQEKAEKSSKLDVGQMASELGIS